MGRARERLTDEDLANYDAQTKAEAFVITTKRMDKGLPAPPDQHRIKVLDMSDPETIELLDRLGWVRVGRW